MEPIAGSSFTSGDWFGGWLICAYAMRGVVIRWMEKTLKLTGVQPDILVINTFEDKLNGRDPQLDRAIEEIMKKLR